MKLHKLSHPGLWAFGLFVVSLIIIGLSTSNFRNPFYWEYTLSGPSSISYGNDGRYYIVDGGYKKVIVLDGNYRVDRVLHGEKKDKGFYYASQVCADSNGVIYIADRIYSGVGTQISKERILQYSATGKYMATIFEQTYSLENGPMQYGNIYSMSIEEETLTFGMRQEDSGSIQRIVIDTKSKAITRHPHVIGEGLSLSDIAINAKTDTIYYTTRLGELIALDKEGKRTFLATDKEGVAWHLDVDGKTQEIYYTDLEHNRVNHIDASGGVQHLYTGDEPIYDVQANAGIVTMTDYSSVSIYKNGQITNLYTIDDHPGWTVILIFFWMVVGAIAGCALIVMLLRRLQSLLNNSVVQRGILIIVVALITTVLVTYLAFSSMFVVTNHDLIKDLNLYGDVLIASMDIKDLKAMDTIEAYESAPFAKMKEALNGITDASYNNGLYYYYIVYKRYEDSIVGVMDYEDTITARHPFFQWGDNTYTSVMKNQETVQVENEVSSYGTWSYVLKPIMEESEDGTRTAIGIMEVGISTDELVQSQERLLIEIIITILCAIVVMIIVMMEVVFYKMHQETNRLAGLRVFPLRTLIFISFLADSMQDAFIPILIAGRYSREWMIPEHIGIALPITMQLLMTALASFMGGFLSTHIGMKKTLFYGFTVQFIGYVVAAITTDYIGILVAKSIVGIGMGLIIVGVNTLAAMDEEDSGRLFSEVNAGILAGVTAGVGVGSVLLLRVEYMQVYLTAAGIIVIGCVLSLFGENHKATRHKYIPVSIKGFFTHREIWPFLVLLLMPFLIALSYREYFFPLYAESMGMTESTIGYLYLLSGLIVIYAGPMFTRFSIQWLGEKGAVLMATAFMAGASILFGILESLLGAVIGIFILSFAISFGYAAQATYYASREVTKSYGEGNAMSVYSLFDNGGQTVGPLLYASALVVGYRGGTLIIGIGVIMCMGFFVLTQRGKVKKRASN